MCHSLFLPLRQKQSEVLNSLSLEQGVNLSLQKLIIYFTVVPQVCQLLHKNTGKQAFPLRAGMMWPLFKAVCRVWAWGSHIQNVHTLRTFPLCCHIMSLLQDQILACTILHPIPFFHGKEVEVWVWRLAVRIRWQIPLVCYNALWSQRKDFAALG